MQRQVEVIGLVMAGALIVGFRRFFPADERERVV